MFHDDSHKASAMLAERLTHTLSGGQKRLVALATPLAMRPRVLLLYEPTNDLYAGSCAVVEGFLRDSGLSLVIVSHDEPFLAALGTRRIHLAECRVVADEAWL